MILRVMKTMINSLVDFMQFRKVYFNITAGHLEGNGLIDRYEYLESWGSMFKRNFTSKSVWARILIYGFLQYYANTMEMGEPFAMLALMYFMAYSLSSGPQSRDKVRSAYSIFNKGEHKTIHGDTTNESLDKQLRCGI
jgi:Uncharacterized conserved domain (SAYSvFN)